MRIRAIGRLSLLALVLGLGACGTTPQSDYYRLSSDAAPGRGDSPSLGIGPIEIPEYLNRNTLIYQTGANQLRVANFERWAEPLQQGLNRVLTLNLSGRLDTQNVRPFPWPTSDRPELAVQVWVLALDASEDSVTLVAEWRLWQPVTGGELTRRISRISEPVTAASGIEASAGFSLLLARLSDEIVAAARANLSAN